MPTMELRVEELKGYIAQIYEADKNSVLLIGLQGIGKTTAVREASQAIAEDLGKEFVEYDDPGAAKILESPDNYFVFVDLNPTHLEPADLTGIPQMTDGRVSYIPLSWATVLAKTAGILFIDELTNVQRPDVMSATFRIVQERVSGFTRFSNETMVIAAGNAPESSSIANLLPSPLVNRFIACQVNPPTVGGWTNWMDKHHPDWDKRTLAHLKHFQEDFIKVPYETESLTNFPTPRSWTAVASLIPKIDSSSWLQSTVGLLGQEVGIKYHTLLTTDLPDIEEFIDNPEIFGELGLNERYLAAILLGSHLVNQKEIRRTIPLFEVMAENGQDFVVLTIMSCGEKKNDVALEVSKESARIKEVLLDLSELRLAWEK